MIFYSISRFFFFLRKTKNGTGSFSSTMENLLRHSSLKNVKWMREIQQSKYVRDFFFGVLYTMFLGLGDWKLENEEEWLIQVRCCLHCCLLPSGSWWKGLKFFFFLTHLRIICMSRRKHFSSLIVHRYFVLGHVIHFNSTFLLLQPGLFFVWLSKLFQWLSSCPREKLMTICKCFIQYFTERKLRCPTNSVSWFGLTFIRWLRC